MSSGDKGNHHAATTNYPHTDGQSNCPSAERSIRRTSEPHPIIISGLPNIRAAKSQQQDLQNQHPTDAF